MHVTLLGAASSVHLRRLAEDLAELNHEVSVITDRPPQEPFNASVKLVTLPLRPPWSYLLCAVRLRKIIRDLKPDVFHVHYATGYGFLGRLSGRRFILSVWGSDIYSFPQRSIIHRAFVKKNLVRADAVFSTSADMAQRVHMIAPQAKVFLTPFGVDLEAFSPRDEGSDGRIRIGTLRALEKVYGIDILVRAFAKLVQQSPSTKVELHIGGSGSEAENLRHLASDLEVTDRVHFTGRIPPERAPEFMRSLDILVVPSRSESWGVVSLEGSASGIPVVAARTGGLVETVLDGKTGFLFRTGDANELCERLKDLVFFPSLRAQLGEAGRNFVAANFSRRSCVAKIVRAYHEVYEMPLGRTEESS